MNGIAMLDMSTWTKMMSSEHRLFLIYFPFNIGKTTFFSE